MYYISEGNVYVKEGEVYRNVGFTKCKTIDGEATTVVIGQVTKTSLVNPFVATDRELFAKFGLSKTNPIEVIKEKVSEPKTTKKTTAKKK